MFRIRLTAAFLSLLLCLAACSGGELYDDLKPDLPAEEGGVGRYTRSAPTEEENAGAETDEDGLRITRDDSDAYAGPGDWTSSSAGLPADAAGNGQKDSSKNGGMGTLDQLSGTGAASGASGAVSEGSLSPFGAYDWWIENGVYKYDAPAQNTSGKATVAEMYSFPNTRFDDANKPPDDDNWFFGQVSYDESTGEVSYGWDRWTSTKETLAKYGAIYRGDETRKVIYLTFDCGYEWGATEGILDALRDKGAPGTFFLTGPFVRGESDLFDKDYMYNLIRRMLDEGHIVGSHTNTHPDMTAQTVDQVLDEMRQVEEAYKSLFPDAPDMIYFRPPRGAVNEWLIRLEAKLGYRTVMWSFAYYDYDVDNQWHYEDALDLLKSHLHPGCVYLLHAESFTNAAILPEFIEWVRSQGYVIEPLCGIGA